MDYNKLELKKAVKMLNRAHNIVILAPDIQDPDSVSSNLALKRSLESMGKLVRWLGAGGSSRYFNYIAGNNECEDTSVVELLQTDVDVVVMTDAGSVDQFQRGLKGKRWLIEGCPTILFDHHAVRGGEKFGAEVIGTAAATGELLYYVYNELGWKITPEIAQLMMIGLQADTDTFSNLGLGADCFRVAAALIELGADAGVIAEEIKESNNVTPKVFPLFNDAIAKVHFDGAVAYAALDARLAARIAHEADPCHYIVSTIRFVKGIKMSFVLLELQPGVYRLSMRSRHGYRAANVAQQFGGGGHAFMAGATIKTSHTIEQVTQLVLKKSQEEIAATHAKNL